MFINDSESVESKMAELYKTIRFRIKKGPWMATAIGLEDQTPEELRQNLLRSVNFLVSLLPKGWQNIGSLTIKTTMGKPVKLF